MSPAIGLLVRLARAADPTDDVAVRYPGLVSESVPLLHGTAEGWQLVARTAPTWANEPGAQAVRGDFDGDGTVDLALHRPGVWGEVRVLFDRYDKWVPATSKVPEWASARGVIAVPGDFDRDGDTDLAFVRPGSDASTLPVLLSRRDGTWTEVVGAASASAQATGAIALPGDFDGDGDTDLAFHHPEGIWKQLVVLTSKGDGTWSSSARTVASWVNAAGAVAIPGDFDGDGRTDLAFYQPRGGSSLIPILLSKGDATFTAVAPKVGSWAAEGGLVATAGDFDGDGLSDLAFRQPGGKWTTVPMLLANGDGSWAEVLATAPEWAHDAGEAEAGDFDGDGDSDIAFLRSEDGDEDAEDGPFPVLYSRGFDGWGYTVDPRPDLFALLEGAELVRSFDTVYWLRAIRDGGDPAYDATPADTVAFQAASAATLESLYIVQSETLQILPGFDWYGDVLEAAAFTGTYDGMVYNGGSSAPATLVLRQAGDEARGVLYMTEPDLEFDGGLICGTDTLGLAALPVRFTTAGPFPGWIPQTTFTGAGSTTREASMLGVFSGEATISFAVELANHLSLDSWLTGTADIAAPGVCSDQHLSFVFTRRNLALFAGMGAP